MDGVDDLTLVKVLERDEEDGTPVEDSEYYIFLVKRKGKKHYYRGSKSSAGKYTRDVV